MVAPGSGSNCQITISTREQCWVDARNTFGTAEIFKERASSARKKLRTLSFVGLGVPLTIGAIVSVVGVEAKSLSTILLIAGGIGAVQVIFSGWAVVAKWDDALSYAIESMTDNFRLAADFERLAKTAPQDIEVRYEVLNAQNQSRIQQDNRQDITDKEQRRGYHMGLFQLRHKCPRCDKVPDSKNPTDCPVCGNF